MSSMNHSTKNVPRLPIPSAGATDVFSPLQTQRPLRTSPAIQEQKVGAIALPTGHRWNVGLTVSGATANDISPPSNEGAIATATDVARYILALAIEDGDLITNLKMQKLIYYAYAHTLINNGVRLFSEPIEAWPNGPVVKSLYHRLKQYGSNPISEDFLGFRTEGEFDRLAARFPAEVLETLNGVYETYMPMSAFQLVMSTHNEKPWREARRGLTPTEISDRSLADDDIIEQFSVT